MRIYFIGVVTILSIANSGVVVADGMSYGAKSWLGDCTPLRQSYRTYVDDSQSRSFPENAPIAGLNDGFGTRYVLAEQHSALGAKSSSGLSVSRGDSIRFEMQLDALASPGCHLRTDTMVSAFASLNGTIRFFHDPETFANGEGDQVLLELEVTSSDALTGESGDWTLDTTSRLARVAGDSEIIRDLRGSPYGSNGEVNGPVPLYVSRDQSSFVRNEFVWIADFTMLAISGEPSPPLLLEGYSVSSSIEYGLSLPTGMSCISRNGTVPFCDIPTQLVENFVYVIGCGLEFKVMPGFGSPAGVDMIARGFYGSGYAAVSRTDGGPEEYFGADIPLYAGDYIVSPAGSRLILEFADFKTVDLGDEHCEIAFYPDYPVRKPSLIRKIFTFVDDVIREKDDDEEPLSPQTVGIRGDASDVINRDLDNGLGGFGETGIRVETASPVSFDVMHAASGSSFDISTHVAFLDGSGTLTILVDGKPVAVISGEPENIERAQIETVTVPESTGAVERKVKFLFNGDTGVEAVLWNTLVDGRPVATDSTLVSDGGDVSLALISTPEELDALQSEIAQVRQQFVLPGVWTMLSPPGDVGGMPLASILPEELSDSNFRITWAAYVFDVTTQKYRELRGGDALKPGQGFWFLHELNEPVELNSRSGERRTVQSLACPSVAGCHSIELADGIEPAGVWALMGNPLAVPLALKDTYWAISSGGEAVSNIERSRFNDEPLLTHDVFFQWDPINESYDLLSASDPISPWSSVWAYRHVQDMPKKLDWLLVQ